MYGDGSEMFVLTCHTVCAGQIICKFIVLLPKVPHVIM